MREARASNAPLLVEATSNQVNQFGGYTGMTPVDFRRFVLDIARQVGLREELCGSAAIISARMPGATSRRMWRWRSPPR